MRRLIICLALAIAIFAIYAPGATYGFVNFDDDIYVYKNHYVQAGLTRESLKWAFTNANPVYWQPLLWISFMLDCQLFGLGPGPHHLVNVGLHAVNAILLFLLLEAMTHAFWRSASLAALFAVHPLRVESVAWISERKDVLSGLFWILTLWAYYFYARTNSLARYLLLLGIFVLGLMAKPMLITLPFILLVVDYWPLRRWKLGNGAVWLLLREKLPLMLLSIGVTLITVSGLERTNAVAHLSWAPRFANACSAYVQYLRMLAWPEKLTVLYPYRFDLPVWRVLLCCGLLIALTAAALVLRRQRPYLYMGWLWYVMALAPTVGLIQSGPQALADRFTYLPSIGIMIAVIWFVAEEAQKRRVGRVAVILVAATLILTFSVASANQVQVWKDGVTLFTRAAEFAPENAIVQHNLGYALAEEGRYGEAIPHYQAALKMDPHLYRADYNLGRALYEQGQLNDAILEFQKTLQARLAPDYESDVRNALGIAFTRRGRIGEAEAQFRASLALKPLSPEIHANLGSFLALTGRLDEAIAQYKTAVQLNPDYTEAHLNLGRALAQSGRRNEALQEFRAVLRQVPDNREAQAQVTTLNGVEKP